MGENPKRAAVRRAWRRRETRRERERARERARMDAIPSEFPRQQVRVVRSKRAMRARDGTARARAPMGRDEWAAGRGNDAGGRAR